MRWAVVLTCLSTLACGPGKADGADARVADAGSKDAALDARVVDGGAGPDSSLRDGATADATSGPYRHTITIDGVNDFTAAERIDTTSTGYAAYLSWDADALYLGYQGDDLAGLSPDASRKWLFAYFDRDLGLATGTASGQIYNTETPMMPSGFLADLYLRWKTSDDFMSLESWSGTAWTSLTAAVTHTRTGSFVEFRIPLAALGSPSHLGIVTLMMNETQNIEASYAGLYPGSFVDGYHASVPLSFYLDASFAGSDPPSAASRHKP